MPPTTQPRMLSTDPRRLATQNARGGIDRTSQAELAGARPQGSTGTLENLQVKPAQPLVAPRLNPTIPDVIPSTALAGNKTFEDVMDTRADLETQATAKQQLNDRIKGIGDRIGASSKPTFNEPDAIINRLLLNRAPSQTENQRTQAFNTAQQTRRDFAGDIATARTQANEQFGVPDLVARKAEVTQQYAEREAQLDADIKRIEYNASKRGVDRAAVEDMKRATKSAALEDLANFAAIEAAVSGSITEARTIINDTINDKKAAFELENQAIQQEIDYLSTLVGEDNEREASQLQFALNERKAAQDAKLAKETEIKELMVNVASEGADDGTINAIKNATSVEEAIRYASPFLGRMDREAKQASIRASNASAALNEAELTAFNKTQEDAAKGILTSDQVKTANELNKDFESQPIVKSYNEGLQKYIVLEDTLADGIDGVQDLQLVYDFMKSVDPASVVRETEFATAAKTGNIFQGAYASFNKAFGTGGFLPEQVKQDFIRAARASFEAKNNQYYNVKSEYADRINRTVGTSNGADYLTAYEGAAPLTEADNDIVFRLSGASPEEIQDIMLLTEQIMSNGVQGATIYK